MLSFYLSCLWTLLYLRVWIFIKRILMATFLDKILAVFKGESKASSPIRKEQEVQKKSTTSVASPEIVKKSTSIKKAKSSMKISAPKAANAKKPTSSKKK